MMNMKCSCDTYQNKAVSHKSVTSQQGYENLRKQKFPSYRRKQEVIRNKGEANRKHIPKKSESTTL